MTSSPKEITVTCPDSGHAYEDWYRQSFKLSLDYFDDDYLDQTTTTTCPECGDKYDLGTLFARRGGDGGTVLEV